MRQKEQRPTEREFTEAALRFVRSDYPSRRTTKLARAMIICGNVLNFQPAPLGVSSLVKDRDIIAREQMAEGLVPGEEELEVFARHQLIRYRDTGTEC